MRFLNELHEGDRVSGIYLCKQVPENSQQSPADVGDRNADGTFSFCIIHMRSLLLSFVFISVCFYLVYFIFQDL